MKQLTCEMCGSTDLVKQDGLFVCQTCGCKYSVEEARKMMVEGTVEVTGTVKVDNTAQIENYLELSQNAYESGNGQSAFDYANKALEIAPQNHRAWICKMKSIEYIATLGNLRMMEVIEAGKSAVNYAPDDQKDAVIHEVYKYQLARALSLLKLAMNKMRETADIKRTFQSFAAISVFTATNNTLAVDSKVVNIYESVTNEAVACVKLVPVDALNKNRDLAKFVGECAKQYQYVTDALIDRYKIYGAELLDSAKSQRSKICRELQEKSDKAIRIYDDRIAEEKRIAAKKRFDEFWEANADKKAELETERASLEGQAAALKQKIAEIPGADEKATLQERIDALIAEKSALGIFKGKEKKQIQAKIDEVKSSLDVVEERMRKEKAVIDDEIAPLEKRIAEITRELTKER